MYIDPHDGGQLTVVDLQEIIGDWPFAAGDLTVRIVTGMDGRRKVQERVDLGVAQFEYEGRPDGRSYPGFESLLDLHIAALNDYERRNGTGLGFELIPLDCQDLLAEAELYGRRCQCLLELGENSRAVEDAIHCLRIACLCEQYAVEDKDRDSSVMLKPEFMGMRVRASALTCVENDRWSDALVEADRGLYDLLKYYRGRERADEYDRCEHVRMLEDLRSELADRVDPDPRRRLRRALRAAVKDERYADAARLRDEFKKRFGT